MLGFRGASRYIDKAFRGCFELECRALKRVREEMGLLNVQIMVPFVRTLAEAKTVTQLLADNGLKRGDKFAVIGGNRPRLYWAMCAGQALGAVPVPIYADSVADEMAYVLDHAETSIAIVEDQEQVDKVLSISERVPKLALMA